MFKPFISEAIASPLLDDVRHVQLELADGSVVDSYEPFDYDSLQFGTFDDWRLGTLVENGINPSVITQTSTTRAQALNTLGEFSSNVDVVLETPSSETKEND